jgi:hypothetical protein
MNRKVLHKTGEATFTYGELERAMASVFAIPPAGNGALRARLKHLARLGMGLETGKGTRAQYTRDLCAQLLIALLLAEVGIDPAIAVQTIKTNWKTLAPSVQEATDGAAQRGNPIYLELQLRVMSSALKGGPSLQIFPFRRFATVGPNRDEVSSKVIDDSDHVTCLINLSGRLFQLKNFLPRKE